MKRFCTLICSLLLVFTLVSCGNLSIAGKQDKNTDPTKGTMLIKASNVNSPDSGRAAIVPEPTDVTEYHITVFLEGLASSVFSNNFTPDEISKGVKIPLAPGDYLVHVTASDENGELFSGKTEENVKVTLENTDEKPAVATVNMKYVLVVFDNGPGATHRLTVSNTLEDGVKALRMPDSSGLPTIFGISGKKIVSWTDKNNENAVYLVGDDVKINNKKLPLRLTATWEDIPVTPPAGDPEEPTGPRYTMMVKNAAGEIIKKQTITGTEDEDYIVPKVPVPLDGYTFCGWAKNTEIPVITDEDSYTANRDKLLYTYTLYPGEKDRFGADETVLYAVWVNSSLTDKISSVKYALGAGEDAISVVLGFVKEAIYMEGQGYRYILPAPADLFPEWNSIPESGRKTVWSVNGTAEEYSAPGSTRLQECPTSFVNPVSIPIFKFSTNYEENQYFDVPLFVWPIPDTLPLPDHVAGQSMFNRDGYELTGWKDNNGKFYALDASIPKDELPANLPLELKAQWEEVFITMVSVPRGTVTSAIGNGAFSSSAIGSGITVNAFKIGQTEVTYAQWKTVYDWATSDERGDKVYSFANQGSSGYNAEGAALTESNGDKAVTTISWRDAVVWCNAASEYQGLEPVYYYFAQGEAVDFDDKTKVIRKAETNGESPGSEANGQAENATVNPNANGYRLPTEGEWEYAARGADPNAEAWSYTYAGSNTANDVCVNSKNRVEDWRDYAHVKTKGPNTLNLYDMSGNVMEFLWKKKESSPKIRYLRGGSYMNSPSYTKVDYLNSLDYPTTTSSDAGFRVVSGGAGNFDNL